jgi:hypothetical protein
MSQIIRPIQLKSQVIVGVHHLMRHSIFQMAPVLHFVGADLYAIVRVEATCLALGASPAVNVV